MNIATLENFLKERQQKPYRLAQAKEAFCVHLATSWEDVTPWPKELRDEAATHLAWDELTMEDVRVSERKNAIKFLFSCADGSKIESVIMRYESDRNTVCISCQVGCPMKCAFCATGAMGFTRNLTASEIYEQVIHAARWLKKERNEHVSNVVYMGMGEPMHNYDVVMESVRLLNDPKGFGIGVRHISISTCGIVPGILKLAKEPEQVNLAISLHSAVEATRSKIMPVNRAYPISELMRAIRTYVATTNRKVMFEYLLIRGVNDSREDAESLADLLEENPRLYHVNLIKYHDTHAFVSTDQEHRRRFLQWLRDRGIPVTPRHSFGEDILAACGQLAGKGSR